VLRAVIVGLVISDRFRSARPRGPHRSDLRTLDLRRQWRDALPCARHEALPATAPPAHAWSAAPPGAIALLQQNDERVMVLSGEIDVDTVQAFEARMGFTG
jgi:anti-anti-sigma factor